MAKYRARVDCYLEPSLADAVDVHSRANGEFFVNLIQHISSSMSDLGIEMLAWNYGNGGSDWTFWNEPGSAGKGAFACFRFHSASFGKFDCLIYENTGSYTNHTGSVYIHNQNGNYVSGEHCYFQVGIAFACHPSGSVPDVYPYTDGPWNGSYGSGADIQTSSEIWKTTPESKGAFFPRPNGILGESSGSRAALQGLGGYQMHGSRNHFIVSEDSLTILTDSALGGNHRIMHFGPYTPRSGTTPTPESPYVMWSSNNPDSFSPWVHFYGNQIGTTSRVDDNTYQGALAHPDLLSGTVRFSWNTITTSDMFLGLNKFVENGSYEKFPVWVTINEGPDCGTLGILNHLWYGIGMPNLSVSAVSSSAAFGRMTMNENKVLVPWSGDPPTTTSWTRKGRNFSIG